MKFLFQSGNSANILEIRKNLNAGCMRTFTVAVLIAGMCQSGAAWTATTLCVNPGGTSGCYPTIGAAVEWARMDYLQNKVIDTINVAAGIYTEDVMITTPLSLVGAGRGQSIINAMGLANGIYVDGIDNPGPEQGCGDGFTIENANFEGILVTNASFVTILAERGHQQRQEFQPVWSLVSRHAGFRDERRLLIAVKESISLALITRRWSITLQRKTPAGFCSAMKLARRTTT